MKIGDKVEIVGDLTSNPFGPVYLKTDKDIVVTDLFMFYYGDTGREPAATVEGIYNGAPADGYPTVQSVLLKFLKPVE